MPIEQFLVAAGVRDHSGETGRLYGNLGEIWVSHPSLHGIDRHLWTCLTIAVDQLRLFIQIDATDTGLSLTHDGHPEGRTVDIGEIGPAEGPGAPATLDNPEAARLVQYLVGHGFRIGAGERGPGVIWGPSGTAFNPTRIPHTRHLQVSLSALG